jgi:PII-like signaling protein
MDAQNNSLLLRIFLSETARHGGKPLHEAIVLKAREVSLAGVTVIRGSMGYGKSSLVHTAKILSLSDDLPLVIEIVDTEEKVNAFLPVLEQMMASGVATLEKVRAIHFSGPPAAS